MERLRGNTKKIASGLTIKYGLLVFVILMVMSIAALTSVKLYTDKQSSDLVENIKGNIETELDKSESFSGYNFNGIAGMNRDVEINIKKNGNLMFQTEQIDRIEIPVEEIRKPEKIKDSGNRYIYLNKEFVNARDEKFNIQVVKDMADETSFIAILFWIILILDIILMLAAIALASLISKRALKPIEDMTKQAKEINGSDLSKRISVEGPDDELKLLAETFNDVIAGVENEYGIKNRFALDASHEMVTPLAIINGHMDVIRRFGKEDPQILDESIDSVKTEIKNMTNLLKKLLLISRTDNEILKIEKDRFPLDEVVSEVAKESRMIYKNFNIRISENELLSVFADRRLIKEMLRIVIDNSVKYSSKDSKVLIDSRRVENDFKIEISDQGIGIPAEDLPHVFDQFYRVDKERNTEIGGAGLGLSIVDWIVEGHGGKIDIESEMGKGTKLTIIIPIYKKYKV